MQARFFFMGSSPFHPYRRGRGGKLFWHRGKGGQYAGFFRESDFRFLEILKTITVF
jgi:hypothetical protein